MTEFGGWTAEELVAAIDEGEASGDGERSFDEIIAEARASFGAEQSEKR